MESELVFGMSGYEIIDIGYKAVIILVPIAWAIVKYFVSMSEKTKEIIDDMVARVVNETYIEFVREEKKDDKKLSNENIFKAREIAWNKFVDIAKKSGITIGSELEKQFPVMIDMAISKMRGA